MTPAPVCRICGSGQSSLISRQVSGASESAVYRCGDCDLVYLFPIMTEAEEREFYQKDFDSYMSARNSPGWKSPAQHFAAFQAEGERRLGPIREFLAPGHDVLEIGSSTGYFLDDLRGYVATVAGVEPHTEYASYASGRGIPTVPALNALNNQKFDVILMYYVLEHLRDPVGYLAGLAQRLKPGGQLIIEVPNVEDALLGTYEIPAFGPFYWQKAHYDYFSHRTLSDVLRRAGYTARTIPVQRYDLSNHLIWMMKGKPGGAGAYRHLFSPELEAAYAETLKRHWLCDTVLAVAKPVGRG